MDCQIQWHWTIACITDNAAVQACMSAKAACTSAISVSHAASATSENCASNSACHSNPLLQLCHRTAGAPDASCNSGLNFCLNVTSANVICKYAFRNSTFTCRSGPPAAQCPGNSAFCPPADPQVPIVGLTVTVNGFCNDNVHNTILASVQGQLVTNAGAVGPSVKGEKTNCTNVRPAGNSSADIALRYLAQVDSRHSSYMQSEAPFCIMQLLRDTACYAALGILLQINTCCCLQQASSLVPSTTSASHCTGDGITPRADMP
jgi:hypothetical protein